MKIIASALASLITFTMNGSGKVKSFVTTNGKFGTVEIWITQPQNMFKLIVHGVLLEVIGCAID